MALTLQISHGFLNDLGEVTLLLSSQLQRFAKPDVFINDREMCTVLLNVLSLFIYFEREREREQAGSGRETEGTEDPKQDLC